MLRVRLLLAVFLIMTGCTPPVVTLVNPRTGDTRRCSTAEVGAGSHDYASETRIKSCVHQWKSLGYVETENLTAEQRARVAPAR
jgi:hypothetical protein